MKWYTKVLLVLAVLLLLAVGLFWLSIQTRVSIADFLNIEKGPTADVTPSSAVTAQFAGVSTLLLSDGETTILTDGYFSRPGALQVGFGKIEPDEEDVKWGVKRLGITTLDVILVVHSHFDHAMDAPIVSKLTGAPVYGSASTANICRGLDLPEQQIRLLEENKPLQFGKFRVTPILSKHYEFPNPKVREAALGGNQEITEPLVPPVKQDAYKMGGAYTFYFEHPFGNFLLQSSAGWKEHALDSIKADLVFLGVGGLGAQTEAYQSEYFRQIVDQLAPKEVILIHWDALTGAVQEPLQGEVWLIDKLMGKTQETFDVVEREMAGRPDIFLYTLPKWEKRELFR
ncbi:MAG: MBL fold metallo-hydrolase [Saprospiraceae bacterium]|nr:MBL fold metallo-hydrolase [Saprospiraceae bacterium]